MSAACRSASSPSCFVESVYFFVVFSMYLIIEGARVVFFKETYLLFRSHDLGSSIFVVD
jgi:hypothetical protein